MSSSRNFPRKGKYVAGCRFRNGNRQRFECQLVCKGLGLLNSILQNSG